MSNTNFKYCPKCGTKLDVSANFCNNCGFRQGNIDTEAINQSQTVSKNTKNRVFMYLFLILVLLIVAGVGTYFYFSAEEPIAKQTTSTIETAENKANDTDTTAKISSITKQNNIPEIVSLKYSSNYVSLSANQIVNNFPEISFMAQGNRHVIVLDKQGNQLLDLYGPETTNMYKKSGDTYADRNVRQIQLMDGSRTFYAVSMTTGAHAKLEGFWIIGKQDGKWISFISIDNLEPFGFDKTQYHNFKYDIVDGKLILNPYHVVVPQGASQAEGKKVDDCIVTADWDDNAKTFRMY